MTRKGNTRIGQSNYKYFEVISDETLGYIIIFGGLFYYLSRDRKKIEPVQEQEPPKSWFRRASDFSNYGYYGQHPN